MKSIRIPVLCQKFGADVNANHGLTSYSNAYLYLDARQLVSLAPLVLSRNPIGVGKGQICHIGRRIWSCSLAVAIWQCV